MTDPAQEIVRRLTESDDEDLGSDLAKEVTSVSPEEVEERIQALGFVEENGVFVRRGIKRSITIARNQDGVYELNVYRAGVHTDGQRSWVFSHRWISLPNDMDAWLDSVEKYANSFNEALEDEDFDFNDVVSDEDQFREIYNLVETGNLLLHADVKRTNSRYVHEKSTTLTLNSEWNWYDQSTDQLKGEQQAVEERIDAQLNVLEKKIISDMVQWNRKIYRELESAWNCETSEENARESIIANEYRFDTDGTLNAGNIPFDQLSPESQKTALKDWIEGRYHFDDTYYAESVIGEWKWLLKNKGFDGVDISWSGFGSQGDGASFTAESLDILKYLTSPDPLSIPEQERDRIEESQDDSEGGELDFDVQDILSDPPPPVPPAIISVTSSHGNLKADARTGIVVSVERFDQNDPEGDLLDQIERFDIEEWLRANPKLKLEDRDVLDILDLGLHLKDGEYEPPDYEWRQMAAQENPNHGLEGE